MQGYNFLYSFVKEIQAIVENSNPNSLSPAEIFRAGNQGSPMGPLYEGRRIVATESGARLGPDRSSQLFLKAMNHLQF